MNWFKKIWNKVFGKNVSHETKATVIELPPVWAKDLYPELVMRVKTLLKLAKQEGLEVDVFQGFRSHNKQSNLYAKGRTKPGKIVTKAKAGYSWHNFGLAVDVVFKPKGKWSWAEKHDWSRLGELGVKCGLEWGGNWKRFNDRPHFQLVKGLRLADARREFRRGKLPAVWKLIKRTK